MVDMISDPDGPDHTHVVRATRSFGELADHKRRLERQAEEHRIDNILSPSNGDGVERRAGITKRGNYVYYRRLSREGEAERWDEQGEEGRCTRLQEISLRGLAAQKKIGLFHRNGCLLFYRIEP